MFIENVLAQYSALARAKREQPIFLASAPRTDREGNPRITDGVPDITATFVVSGGDGELSSVSVHLRGQAATADLEPMAKYRLGEVSGWLYPKGQNVGVSWSARSIEPALSGEGSE